MNYFGTKNSCTIVLIVEDLKTWYIVKHIFTLLLDKNIKNVFVQFWFVDIC